MSMVPIPVVLWTLTWPFLLLGAITTVPVRWLLITVYRALRLLGALFVFVYAAITDEKETLHTYIGNWGPDYASALSLISAVPISRIYSDITTWCETPKRSNAIVGIVASNLLGIAIVACIVSETARTVIIGSTALLVLLMIWGACS